MYDPTDEKTDRLFGSMVDILRSAPDRFAKQALARLFENVAVLEILLKEQGGEINQANVEGTISMQWDEVESSRNERAADFLYSIQTQEY